MSRVSDTRLRTREAASTLVASGRRPHDLTVDLIYAEIKQGSRTTINDELKLWKDEQAKSDALTAALPAEVSNAMLNMWAVAVEHGEKIFDQRREEAETQLSLAITRVEDLEGKNIELNQQIQVLQEDVAKGQSDLNTLKESLSSERTAKEVAVAKVTSLEQALESTKASSDKSILAMEAEHRNRVQELQASLGAQELAFRQEIAKATERMEGIQKHVILQVDEAREATKRAEAQLSKANQKNEKMASDLQQLGQDIALLTQSSERSQSDLIQAKTDATGLRAERESLIQRLSSATGQIGELEKQIKSLEHRASSAEARLEETLRRPSASKKRTSKTLNNH